MLKVLQVLLAAVLPLLERRTLAAERQAVASERLEDLLRTYLCANDPQFRDLLAGVLPEAEDLSVPPDVYADHGAARDLKTMRMDEVADLYFQRFGSLPDDEQVVRMYEQMYEQDERQQADQAGPGAPPEVAH